MRKIILFCIILILLLTLSACSTTESIIVAEEIHIPTSIAECFEQLDLMLEAEDIEMIKNMDYDELWALHMGLGMWIRNNWLFPQNSELAKMFYDAGFRHFDDVSQFIIVGYHYYLNNDNAIEVYEQKIRTMQITHLLYRLFKLITFVGILAIIRFLFRNAPRPIRFFEKFKHPTFLRVTLALCVSSTIIFFVESFLHSAFLRNFALNQNIDFNNRIIFGEISLVIILATMIAFASLFLFVDMTKKQIVVSAILPTAYFVCRFILVGLFWEYYFFTDHYWVRIFSLIIWPFIFNDAHVLMFYRITCASWPIFLYIIFSFFPFLYAALARSTPQNHLVNRPQ